MDSDKNTHANEEELPYEHAIAYHIVGKLVLDEALNPLNFNFHASGGATRVPGIPFIVNSIAAALLEGLQAYGWGGTGVHELISAAQQGDTQSKAESAPSITPEDRKLLDDLHSGDHDTVMDVVSHILNNIIAPMHREMGLNRSLAANEPGAEQPNESDDEEDEKADYYDYHNNPARQWAKFLIGYMAMQDALDKDDDQAGLEEMFTDALNAAAYAYCANGYRDFLQMCDYAEATKIRKRS